MDDSNQSEEEIIARKILDDAVDSASRFVERRNIKPIHDGSTPKKTKDGGPNWIELMPTTPGSIVKPEQNINTVVGEVTENDNAKRAVLNIPSITGGSSTLGSSVASSGNPQTGSDAARASNPGLQGPQ